MQNKEEKASQFVMLNGCFLALGCHQFVLTYGVEVLNKGICKTTRFYVWNEYAKGSTYFETEKEAKETYKALFQSFMSSGATCISEGL